jgi:hypothetical protein
MLFASANLLAPSLVLTALRVLLALPVSGLTPVLGPNPALAQETGKQPNAAPVAGQSGQQEQPRATISEIPLAIDAATLVPEKLRTLATVEFSEASLGEVAQWLREQTGLNVSLDSRSLEAGNVDENSPVSDQLENQPLYLLLDRLSNQRITWRLDGGILRLQASDDPSVLYNRQYNVGDLLDQKFKGEDLKATLLDTVVNESDWSDADGADGMVLLGDVLFIRQDDRTHRRVAGLLAALRTPARRVLVDDPLEHSAIRDALGRNISVDFKARSLGTVVDELAEQAAIDLRLDRSALLTTRITERTPVTFELRDQSVRKTLDLLLQQLKLSWVLRDGVIWVTPAEIAEKTQRTAVFDVRDICPEERSSAALEEALKQQVDSKSWSDSGGIGEIYFAQHGVMVLMQTEQRLDAILELIGNYRTALRNSKPRVSPEDDPEVIETRFYRMPTEVAEDLAKLLPSLLATDSWRTDKQPGGVGTIQRVRSWSEVATAPRQDAAKPGESALIPYSVLIIEQRRKVHDQIPEIVNKIKLGSGGTGGGMGGGGMGGTGKGPAGGGIF